MASAPIISGSRIVFRREQTSVVTKELRCPERGSPLLEPIDPKRHSSRSTVVIVSTPIILVLAVGAVMWTPICFATRVETIGQQSAIPGSVEIPSPTSTPTITPKPTPTATPDSSATPLDLDLAGEATEQVKRAIIKRIKRQPTLAQDQKERILASVESAKAMGRIAVISFPADVSNPSRDDVALIVSQLNTPQTKNLLQDPTVILVVLGYADLQEDNQKSLELSHDRAEAVVQILREKCEVLNVIQLIPMGGTDLRDPHGFARNRTVEVWAGLP
jgi:outer membrane protein OmpA-like peptidoglycan-associated protein